jgi:hypothetical protein
VKNPDGVKPYASGTLAGQLRRWQAAIDLRDEAGVRVDVTPHRFRHTVGTRLINSGVPQHVVQKLLGHASPRMTAHYAHLHDRTVPEAFERYKQLRVNTAGEILPFVAEAAAERRAATLRRAKEAIELLDNDGVGITFCAVARTAGVSRAWLYRNDELRRTIEGQRMRGPAPTTPAAQRATLASLRERLDASRDEIARLSTENAELRDRLARLLGGQRARR